jgi:hypothetical protein
MGEFSPIILHFGHVVNCINCSHSQAKNYNSVSKSQSKLWFNWGIRGGGSFHCVWILIGFELID